MKGITEVKENTKKAQEFLKYKSYDTEMIKKTLDSIRQFIPNSQVCECKFLLGLVRIFLTSEMISGEEMAKINNILEIIGDLHSSEFDCNLNGISLRELLDFERTKPTTKANPEYTIVPIDTEYEAAAYSKHVPWGLCNGSFLTNTAGGRYRVYFCLGSYTKKTEDGSKNMEALKNEYGLSMIAVTVTMEGECHAISSRWDSDDRTLNEQELEKLLGGSFKNLFPPHTKKYLIENGLYISNVIGKYYLDEIKGIEGIIAAVDENENPTDLISISEQKTMTWYEAMEYNKTLTNGWHIPTIDEFKKIWFVQGQDNIITKKINDGLMRYDKIIARKFRIYKDEKLFWTNPEGVEVELDITKPIII